MGMPRILAVSTTIDALSHSLESIWNINANPVSTNFAVAAATEILETLPDLVANLGSLALRGRMARAALLAGLAFSKHSHRARPFAVVSDHAAIRPGARCGMLVQLADVAGGRCRPGRRM